MIRKGNDLFVVIGSVVIIRAPGETISMIQSAGQVFENVAELRQGVNVASDATIDFLGVTVMSQICVVDEDLHRYSSACKQVSPMEEAINEAHKFLIPDVVITLSFRECMRGSSHHPFLSSVIQLKQGCP